MTGELDGDADTGVPVSDYIWMQGYRIEATGVPNVIGVFFLPDKEDPPINWSVIAQIGFTHGVDTDVRVDFYSYPSP